MSPQPSLFSLPVWLALGHLIFPHITSGATLYDPATNMPHITDVGNCFDNLFLPGGEVFMNCDFALAAAAMAYKNPNIIKNVIQDQGNGMATVQLYDYDGKIYIPVTVPITNDVPASAAQSPLAVNPSIVWPTVLQNAVIQLPVQAPHSKLAARKGFNGDWMLDQAIYGPLAPGNTLSAESLSGTTHNFQIYWDYAGLSTRTMCTSSSDELTVPDNVQQNVFNHGYVAIDCVDSNGDPLNNVCQFPASSVKLYDPAFTGQPKQLYFLDRTLDGVLDDNTFMQDAQGYITLTYEEFYNIFNSITCNN